MSIEKLSDNSKVYAEKSPFTQILNDVIEHIKDNDAFRLYCFLISKSRDWTVIKEWTAKNCDVGITKAKQCWSYLERCGLIEYVPVRDAKGKFIKHDMHVLIGTKFIKDEPFIKPEKPTGMESDPVDTHWYEKPPGGKPSGMEKRPLLNKDSDQQEKSLQNKEKSSFNNKAGKTVDNSRRHDFAKSMDQMAGEDKASKQNEDYKRSRMPDALRKMCKSLPRRISP